MPERPSGQFRGTLGKAEDGEEDPPAPVSAVPFLLQRFPRDTIPTWPQMDLRP